MDILEHLPGCMVQAPVAKCRIVAIVLGSVRKARRVTVSFAILASQLSAVCMVSPRSLRNYLMSAIPFSKPDLVPLRHSLKRLGPVITLHPPCAALRSTVAAEPTPDTEVWRLHSEEEHPRTGRGAACTQLAAHITMMLTPFGARMVTHSVRL